MTATIKLPSFSIPKIMGVINVTPDSFYAGSRAQSIDDIFQLAEQMVQEGADILDIGAEATNPNLDLSVSVVSTQQELDRLAGVIEGLSTRFDVMLSIDTSKPEVMQAAVAAGAQMINDQRALLRDGALAVAAQCQVPVCLMQMFGPNARTFNDQPYADTVQQIADFLQQRIDACLQAGIAKEQLMVDPGFGTRNFGKSTQENLYLLAHVDRIQALGYPVLMGFSRKSMMGEVLGVPPEERLYGSLGLAVLGAQKGAAILRVHDVGPTVQAVTVAMATQAMANEVAYGD